jgi:hypothetical protein
MDLSVLMERERLATDQNQPQQIFATDQNQPQQISLEIFRLENRSDRRRYGRAMALWDIVGVSID